MITTQTNREFIEEQYADYILENMQDGLLPGGFYRDVSEFGRGEVFNIKTVGEVQLVELEEDKAITYSPIDSGEVQLRITDYVGRGFYITDEMKEDGTNIDALVSASADDTMRKIQEHFETRALETLGDALAFGSTHAINGFARLLVGSGTNDTMASAEFIAMRLAFNKAEVPMNGRIAIVDPIVEATMNTSYGIVAGTGDLAANPTWQMIQESGMARDHSFIIRLYGWDIMTSNRLPTAAAATATDGTATVTTAAVGNIFMCVADDNCKPLMAVWRRPPRTESGRNKDKGRDEYLTKARYGFGIQRLDTLGVVWTSSTLYS